MTEEKPVVEIIEPIAIQDIDLGEVFVLNYRKGNNICVLNFVLPRKEEEKDWEFVQRAIIRGQKHCEIMRLRFLFVTPFITDLETSEKRMVV